MTLENLWIALGLALGVASQTAPAPNAKTIQPLQEAPAANAPTKAGLERRDQLFVERAARAAQAEIAAGRLAATRSASEEVKAFAREVVEHHGRASRELAEIAIKKGVSWPVAPHWWQQRELKRLQALSGHEFDRRYMHEAGVDDHEDTLKLFRKAQKDVKDAELKAFFDRTLPVVEKHFEMARAIERSLKEDRATAATGNASAGSSKSR